MVETGLDGTTGPPRPAGEGSAEGSAPVPRRVFGDWIFAPDTGELWGLDPHRPPKLLRPQLRALLELLSAHPGQLVTRAEIHRALWGETVVDLDRGLNFCVRQLRETLGDDARRPRYVETLPRQGYRFVAEVAVEQVTEVLPEKADDAPAEPGRPPRAADGPPDGTTAPEERLSVAGSPGRTVPRRLAVAVGVMLAGLVGLWIAQTLARGPSSDQEASALGNPAFREALETGRLLMSQGLGSMDRAERALTRAVSLDPDSAEAWAELAKANLLMADREADRYEAARTATRRALELDPRLPVAHVRRGELQSLEDHDWPAAEATFRHALELDPDHVEALHRLAFTVSMLGRDEEALAIMERARLLDPMSTLLVGDAVVLHLYAGRYEQADALARKLLELSPEAESLHVLRVFVLEKLEKWPEAGEAVRSLAALDGREPPERPTDAEGLKDFWRRRLEELETETGSPARLARASVHAHLGDASAALDELEAVAASRSIFLCFQLRDPRLAILYDEPRFQDLLAGVGLSGVPWAI